MLRTFATKQNLIDFTPKLTSIELDANPYTPDGLIIQKSNTDFVLELKASWNDRDVSQVIKYGKSPSYLLKNGNPRSFNLRRCVLLAYQNSPGETNLDKFFDSWASNKLEFSLVILRYSLEQSAEGDRIYFSRVPYERNGQCPSSYLGKALNSPRGFSVTAQNFKKHRSKFHKTNDQMIPSYAAVLWWTKYAMYYLSDDQKSEMAVRGRLSSPLVVKMDQLANVPQLPEVEVPMGPRDIRRALEFLRQAKLVTLKQKEALFEIDLKEDKFIRLPQNSAVARGGSDITAKILARWATHKVKKPILLTKRMAKPRTRIRRDKHSGSLFDSSPKS